MSRIERSELRQEAALKCLAAGHSLNPRNPYSGSYYHAAWKSVEHDIFRRNRSQDRRVASFFDCSTTRERYCSDMRHLLRGSDGEDPAAKVEMNEQLLLLLAAVAELKSRPRVILEACDLREETLDIVARQLGITKSALMNQRYRTRLFLRNKMQAR
jgi:RNA polymerase sigma factor (sigma-70 family)